MLFDHYQAHARTTALDTAKNLGYLIPGLVAEVGELTEVFYEFDGVTPDMRPLSHLRAEVGDVMWFVSLLADHFGYALAGERFFHDIEWELEEDDQKYDTDTVMTELLRNCGIISGMYAKGVRDNGGEIREKDLEDLITNIVAIGAWALQLGYDHGLEVSDILDYNIDKLLGRKERGTIGGDGNVR